MNKRPVGFPIGKTKEAEVLARALWPDAVEYIFMPPAAYAFVNAAVYPDPSLVLRVLRGEVPKSAMTDSERIKLEYITFDPPHYAAGYGQKCRKVFIIEIER